MKLITGDFVSGVDCHGAHVSGTIVHVLLNTVIIESDTQRAMISKKELKKQGYRFAPRGPRTNPMKRTEIYRQYPHK